MTVPIIAMIGLGRMGRPYADAIHARGARMLVVDHAEGLETPGTKAVLGRDDILVPVEGDVTEEDWFTAALAACGGRPVSAVLPFSEAHVLPAALLARVIGAKGVGLTAAQVSRNKSYQRALFANMDVPQPPWTLARTHEEAKEWSRGRYPVVLKPLNLGGSEGVTMANSESDIDAWTHPSGSTSFLVEEFIAGDEISVECLIHGGQLVHAAVTRKVITGPPQFVEIGQSVSPEEAEGIELRAAAIAKKVVRCIGAETAVVHLEIILTPHAEYVVEFAARTPGDHILELHRMAGGPDYFDAIIAAMMDLDLPTMTDPRRVARSFFPQFPPGRLVAIEGLTEAQSLPGVEHLYVHADVGDIVEPLLSSGERVLTAVISGQDEAAVNRTLSRVQSVLRLDIVHDN